MSIFDATTPVPAGGWWSRILEPVQVWWQVRQDIARLTRELSAPDQPADTDQTPAGCQVCPA